MSIFERPEYFYGLLLLPLFWGLFRWNVRWQKQVIARLGGVALVQRLAPRYRPKAAKRNFILWQFALFLLLLALANPRVGTKKERVEQRGVDIFIALDVSNSMLAADLPPNRLERAKQLCYKLMATFKTDRVGLILFAGTAHVQVPLTTDFGTAQVLVKTASPDMISTQGTAIGAAISLAEESFEEENKRHKALILLSDGEEHAEGAAAAARQARENGMIILTVGVGSEKPTPILMAENNQMVYKRDANGEIVQTKLNEGMLRDIARAGRGAYHRLQSDEVILESLESSIRKMEQRSVGEMVFTEFRSHYQWLVAGALLLLLLREFLASGAYKKVE